MIKSKSKKILIFLVLLAIVIIPIATIPSCNTNRDNGINIVDDNYGTPKINSVHVALGVPEDNDSTDDYDIIRSQYIISYNKDLGVANWVAWNLDADWYGDVPRYSGNFIADTSLPSQFYKVKHSDYTNSGYDRGHMVRSEERTKTDEDNKSTFFLTNIIPQTPDLNQGVWLKLEYYCEDLCKQQNKELYVIAGGIYHTKEKIKGLVTIPDSCFKIIVVLNRNQGLKNIDINSEVIAVVMPNISGVRSDDWMKYSTTVDRIEFSTGYDFLNCLPKKIQAIIEAKQITNVANLKHSNSWH
ncbi:MAG: DNA/RNA non-specific endonuclease [Candidatus Kapabacteria bacterium]|nr:DNA/RNA non-specific endonuclease [Candidatus Kapabacteria bacterium]